MLNLPVSALEEDFEKVKSAGPHRMGGGVEPRSVTPVREEPARPIPRPPQPSASVSRTLSDERPEDFFIDVEPPPGMEMDVPLDAAFTAVPAVELPSANETAFCEQLFCHVGDAVLGALVAQYVPDVILANVCTRKFVAAWRAASAGAGDDAFGQLRGELEPGQCAWLDGILLGNERSNMSEMPPEAILQGLLRKLWIAAVRRRQGGLPAASTPENDLRRLTLSGHARLLQRAPWPKASALMVADTLA